MVISAYADLTATLEAINNGQVSRYILKPWREDQLASILRTAIETFQVGALVRGLQTRLLQSEQQAGAQVAIDRMLHELNNPLTALTLGLGFVDSLGLAGGAGALPTGEIVDDVRRTVLDAVIASQALEERIRFFSGGGRADGPSRPARDRFGRAVMSAVAIVRGEAQTRAQLHVDFVPVPAIFIDAVQASQVLVNLLVNAHEAIEPGAPEQNHVSVRVRPAPNGAVVDVEDTGCGIPADMIKHVFEPFVTRKQENAGRRPGSGDCPRGRRGERRTHLGEERSGPGHHVQRRASGRSTRGGGAEAAAREGSPMKTVLLVDDNAPLLRMLGAVFLARHFEVRMAASAAEAIEKLRQAPSEVVVTDLEMSGGENGFQLLERVRKEFPAVRRVVMSGSPMLSREIASQGDLVHASLPKPFEIEQVILALGT